MLFTRAKSLKLTFIYASLKYKALKIIKKKIKLLNRLFNAICKCTKEFYRKNCIYFNLIEITCFEFLPIKY